MFNDPTEKLCTKAWKYGMRDYNIKGLAWIWHITSEFHGIFTLNLLGLLASETSTYLTIQKLGPNVHIISFKDSPSATRNHLNHSKRNATTQYHNGWAGPSQVTRYPYTPNKSKCPQTSYWNRSWEISTSQMNPSPIFSNPSSHHRKQSNSTSNCCL